MSLWFQTPELNKSRSSALPIKLLFCCVSGDSVGFGHLSRCLALADHAASKKWGIEFLVFGDHLSRERVVEAGYACRLASIKDHTVASVPDPQAVNVVITDIAHPVFLSRQEDAALWIHRFRSLAGVLAVIDSMGDHSMASRFPNMSANLLVVPYVSSDNLPKGTWRVLSGPKYAVLSSAYHDLPQGSQQRNEADRILVTCGGSDPTKLTEVILEGLEQIQKPLEIRVVEGPLFGDSLRKCMKQKAERSRHRITLLDAPESLAEHMLWCDLAISTSGLTKYELAATGTPALLVSIDEFHDRVNRDFSARGSVCDLGVDVTPERIHDEALHLLGDPIRRAEMSCSGKVILDGLGAGRILTEIEKEMHVHERN